MLLVTVCKIKIKLMKFKNITQSQWYHSPAHKYWPINLSIKFVYIMSLVQWNHECANKLNHNFPNNLIISDRENFSQPLVRIWDHQSTTFSPVLTDIYDNNSHRCLSCTSFDWLGLISGFIRYQVDHSVASRADGPRLVLHMHRSLVPSPPAVCLSSWFLCQSVGLDALFDM